MKVHNIEPVFDSNSRILILGSFPSVKSREQDFFYAHPQNRFWKVISGLLGAVEPKTVEEKRILLLKNNIAVWDVIKSCDITGSDDNSIENVIPNDLSCVLNVADIKCIYTNGSKAYELFNNYYNGLKAVKLPSTSPANAQYGLNRLIEAWSVILNGGTEL